MLKSLTFKTHNGNNYLYSYNRSEFYFIHPLLSFFVQYVNGRKNLENWYNYNKNKENLKIDNVVYSKDEMHYYYKKFIFFKDNGIVNKANQNIFKYPDSSLIEKEMLNNIEIVFEITDKCNLSCKYCSYGELYNNYDNRDNKHLSFKKAKNIIDYTIEYASNALKELPIEIHVGFYGGEPLLAFNHIEKIINYIDTVCPKNITFKYGMTTNGILLNKYIKFLIHNSFALSISLDGDKLHNRYRVFKNGEKSFDKLFNNLKIIQKENPIFFRDNISFLTVVHHKSSLHKINTFFSMEFNKTTALSEIALENINPAHKNEVTTLYKDLKTLSNESSQKYFNDKKPKQLSKHDINALIDLNYRLGINVFENYVELLFGANDILPTPTGTCLPFSKKIFVTINGKMLPCERVGYNHYFGRVTEKEVILNFNKVNTKLHNYYVNIAKYCKNCYGSKICDECMFLMDNIDENSSCQYFINEKQFINILSDYYSIYEENSSVAIDFMKNIIIT